MNSPLRILIVEDSAIDAELALGELGRANLTIEARRVETADAYHQTLKQFQPHVILSDFSMPDFNGMKALTIARELYPHIPFIFVSGTIGEESAIQALKNGATDYVLKSNMLRLPSAVEKAIEGAQERTAQLRVQKELQETCDRLHDILSSLSKVVWSIASPSYELLYISPSITKAYELTPEDFFRGHIPWGQLIHPNDQERAAVEWEQAITSKFFDYEHRVVLPNNGTRWVHNHSKCVTDAKGQLVRIDGISQDITERHQQREKTARVSRILMTVGNLPHEQLSVRELQILLLIGNGRPIKQIAGDLAISINTVNTHRARILKKMGMRTNAALIRYTIEHGIVE